MSAIATAPTTASLAAEMQTNAGTSTSTGAGATATHRAPVAWLRLEPEASVEAIDDALTASSEPAPFRIGLENCASVRSGAPCLPIVISCVFDAIAAS